MRKFLFLLLFLIVAIGGGAYFYALPKAEREITKTIENIGFQDVKINQISYHPKKINIGSIQLDTDGFNVMSGVDIHISWSRFLLKNEIDKITVQEIQYSSTLNSLRTASNDFKKFDWTQINNAPANNIEIKKIIWDVAVNRKAIRFEAGVNIVKSDGKSLMKMAVKAVQNDLTFISQWSGSVDDKEQSFNGVFENLKINHSAFQMNRGNGWISYNNNAGVQEFSAQFDGGSGRIFNIPINNINFIVGQDNTGYPILFRADASGVDGVHFTSDFLYAHSVEDRSFNSTLEVRDLKSFTTYLRERNLISDTVGESTKEMLNTKTYLTYMPERRFPNGPLPFDIYTENSKKKILEGTFLIYPDSYDLRGTIEADKNVSPVLGDLFMIPEDNITDDVIRLEGNIGSLIQ